MHELVTLEAFSRAMVVVAWAGAALGVCAAVFLLVRRDNRRAASLALGYGVLGPLAWLGWRFFLWATYPQPGSIYVGLHHPSRLAFIFLCFLAAGALVGLGLRRLRGQFVGEAE